jgi:hypothetical protein
VDGDSIAEKGASDLCKELDPNDPSFLHRLPMECTHVSKAPDPLVIPIVSGWYACLPRMSEGEEPQVRLLPEMVATAAAVCSRNRNSIFKQKR